MDFALTDAQQIREQVLRIAPGSTTPTGWSATATPVFPDAFFDAMAEPATGWASPCRRRTAAPASASPKPR